MTGITFYEEFQNTRKTKPIGNVIAVFDGTERGGMVDAVASVYDRPNSPATGIGVDRGYLRSRCRRVDEARAREIHPRLFAFLYAAP